MSRRRVLKTKLFIQLDQEYLKQNSMLEQSRGNSGLYKM